MAIDHRARGDTRIHVGHADQHADAAVRQLLCPLDLVEIFGGVVVDGRPKQIAEVLNAGNGGRFRMGLNGGYLSICSSGKIGLETVLDHGGMSRGDKIVV